MHFPIHGQWWSKPSTHTWQNSQCEHPLGWMMSQCVHRRPTMPELRLALPEPLLPAPPSSADSSVASQSGRLASNTPGFANAHLKNVVVERHVTTMPLRNWRPSTADEQKKQPTPRMKVSMMIEQYQCGPMYTTPPGTRHARILPNQRQHHKGSFVSGLSSSMFSDEYTFCGSSSCGPAAASTARLGGRDREAPAEEELASTRPVMTRILGSSSSRPAPIASQRPPARPSVASSLTQVRGGAGRRARVRCAVHPHAGRSGRAHRGRAGES